MASKRIFVIVKTYPQPSHTYREIVCIAGITDDGQLVRLYPFPYRLMTSSEQFRKYQWIEVGIEKSQKDNRPESYKAYRDTLVLGDTVYDWAERRRLIFKHKLDDSCHLNRLKRTTQSLALVKPQKIVDLEAKEISPDWSGKQKIALQSKWLIGPDSKPLEKVPFEFRYRYFCAAPGCPGHRQLVEDWEIFELYRKMFVKYGDKRIAVTKVKEKFFTYLCSSKIDLHFVLGMHSGHSTWMIIGLFYPKNKFPPEKDGQKTFWGEL